MKNHHIIDYQLIRSNRKTLSLQVKNGELIVRSPMLLRVSEIEKFITKKIEWINSKLNTHIFDITEKIYFLGKKYHINNIDLFITDTHILRDFSVQKLLDFYKQEFVKILDKHLPLIAKENSFAYNQVRVKKLKSRWGSCSYSNNLNFNYLLIQAPEFVIKDVIIHELCHTVHKNHSKDFWDLVYKISPEYHKTKQWLKQHSAIYYLL